MNLGALVPWWMKLGGGLVLAAGLAWAVSHVTARLDRANEADRVEADAKRDVANAKALVVIADARTAALKQSLAQAAIDRNTADEIIRKREDANATLLETLRLRVKAASPNAGTCSYGPDARGLFVDLWRRAPGGYSGDALPGPARPPQGAP